jgi:DNA uptake protein ComE-like DNA-binding protein
VTASLAPLKAIAIFFVLLVALPGIGHCAELGVLSPVFADGKPLERAAPGGGMAPVVVRVSSGALYDQLQREAHQGFTASMLALDERAQRASGQARIRPTWLYLSLEDGGFPRSGFWLQESNASHYVAEPFVDLIVDADSVDKGDFEEIFAHELGHVLLRRLLPHLPDGYSRTPHASLSLTDRPTAFDEGFATHFQALARHLTRNERLRLEDHGLASKPFLSYWASNLDRTARIEGVRRNVFVQSQLALPGEGDAIALRDHSTLFDTAHLKSGDQMMAAEGVVATVFYRWLAPGDTDTPALVERYGRLFTALSKLNRNKPNGSQIDPDSPVLIRLLQAYAAEYPQEAAQVMKAFLETTYAATVDPEIARQTEALAVVGRVGGMNVDAYVTQLKAARAALAKTIETTTPDRLDAALSTPLWLFDAAAGDDIDAYRDGLAMDLNTAEREGLAALPRIDAATADRIIEERRVHGPYESLASLSTRVAMPASNLAAFTTLNQAARRAGTYRRR